MRSRCGSTADCAKMSSRKSCVTLDLLVAGDRTPPSHGPEVCALHTAALTSWCLLLSIAPPIAVTAFLRSHLRRLPELLESCDVELRITTGEALALL